MIKHICSWIRLLTMRRKEPYLLFYPILGFIPNNFAYYELALLHRSSAVKTDDGQYLNNERLEFLGDAVLSAIVADILYHRFEGKREGFLTNTRSKIVQRETLNRVALGLGIDKIISVTAIKHFHNNNIYGNAFEALVGAVYLDQGYERCKQFIEEKVINQWVNIDKLAHQEVNFKSKLIEWSQKHKVEVNFDLVKEYMGENNTPAFYTKILLNEVEAGTGVGNSKKQSQQQASKIALKKIKTNKGFWLPTLSPPSPSDADIFETDNSQS